jgi:uncharacterized protein YegJ (DUF2314 family)
LLAACRVDGDRVVRRDGEPNVHIVHGDTALERARDAAHATVDSLFTRWNTSPRTISDAYIKTPIRSHGDVEHIWVEVASIHGSLIKGTIANDPLDPTIGAFGDTIVVDTARLSDWMYSDSLGEHGGFTSRLLQEREERDSLRAVHSPSP